MTMNRELKFVIKVAAIIEAAIILGASLISIVVGESILINLTLITILAADLIAAIIYLILHWLGKLY